MTEPRIWIVVAMWVVTFAVALALDGPVSAWVDRAPLFNPKRNSPWKIPKNVGQFQYLLPVILAVAVFHSRRWRAAVMLLGASAIAGGVYSVAKWVVGRPRPSVATGPFTFDFFAGGVPGFLWAGNLSFPSGHAALAFAVASGMAILMPTWRWLFYLIAAICGVQRILEHAHYPSDIVASALLGFTAAHLADRACRHWLPASSTAGIVAPPEPVSSAPA